MAGNGTLSLEEIKNLIHTIRGLQVMIDSDLVQLYHVEVKLLNRAVNATVKDFRQSSCFK